jgi:hypothetical protein
MLMAWSRPADPEVSDSTDEFRLLKHCGRDGSSGGRGGYLKKSLDLRTCKRRFGYSTEMSAEFV